MGELKGVAKVLQDVVSTAKLELFKCKKLNKKQRERFQSLFGLSELDGDVYYNISNVLLTSSIDYERIKYYINEEDHILKLEVYEYGTYAYAFSFLNNELMKDALGIR